MQLLSDEPVDAAACAVPRERVRGFFARTQELVAATEAFSRRQNDEGGGSADAAWPSSPHQSHAQRVEAWTKAYFELLDDEDRAAMARRGVDQELVHKLSFGKDLVEIGPLNRFISDLRVVEERLSQTPKGRK